MEMNVAYSEEPQIDGYDINRRLGAGGNSTVWVIRNRQTGDELALKILGYDESLRADCLRGPELRHEFLVDEYGLLDTSQGPGLLMEYCPAGSAAAVVAARGPLSIGEAITVMAPVSEALAFLHEQGITHGDVSPRNILFTSEGKPKLGDFGNQSIRGENPSEFGTNGFCAPEVSEFSPTGDIAPARDVYALAACTWYLLTGRAPAPTLSRIPLGAMVAQIDDEFALLLEDALSQDPLQRPSAAEFAQRIFVGGTPTAVELGDVVEPEALKHMLTTKQTEQRGAKVFLQRFSTRQRYGRAHREALKLSQQATVRRTLSREQVTASTDESQWARTHKIHAVGGSRKKFAVAIGIGLALILGGGYLTQAFVTDELKLGANAAQLKPGTTAEPSTKSVKPRGEVAEEILLAAARLTMERDEILMSGRPESLSKIYFPGSVAQQRDVEMLKLMKAKGLKLDFLKTGLSEARLVASSADTLVVEAVSSQGGYNYTDTAGRVVLATSKTQNQRVLIELRRDEGSWKIWNVSTTGDAET